MVNNSKNMKGTMWQYKQAQKVTLIDKIVLFLLFVFGLASIVHFGIWWFQEEHIDTVWLFGLLTFFFWYDLLRVAFIWYTYLHISKPLIPAVPQGLSVAIFTTSYKGEPLEMVRKTLEACNNITYPHTTYLLDNTEDPAFREAALAHNAVWIESINIPGAKAGKINKALAQTKEDFILILDPDHIPFPNFLDNTLGFFNNPEVGFVQVSQAYYNQNRTSVAKAAAQQTYTFYGASQMGYNGMGCAVAIGANCTFRRKAFDSIGGHVEGLAEDLQTSIKLHAAGWKSVYNPVIVSRGIVPEDFGSFAKQQLKWAIGTFGIIYNDLPDAFSKLNFNQKLVYISIATYYFSGFITLIFILIPFVFFLTGALPVNMEIGEFVLNGFWIVVTSNLFYIYSQKWMCDSQTERGFHWRAMILKFATWPVFLFGLLLGLLKKEIPYIPTAKRADKKVSPFAKPFLGYVILFIFTIVAVLIYRRYFIPLGDLLFSTAKTWVMMGFALMVFIMSLVTLLFVKPSKLEYTNDPWDAIDSSSVSKI